MSKYHVNPTTGMPGRCSAKPGNCPYGGDENHYGTYSEAFEQSQANLRELYNLLPKNLNDVDRETVHAIEIQDKEQELMENNMITKRKHSDGDVYEKRDEIRNTEDPELLLGIIDGTLDEDRSWALICAAVQNKHLPREFIEDCIYDKLQTNNKRFTKYLLLNPALTSKDLNYVLSNIDDDEAKLLAYMHPNLGKSTIMSYINNQPNKLTEYPYHGMLENGATLGDEDIKAFRSSLIDKGINPFFNLNGKIYKKYSY